MKKSQLEMVSEIHEAVFGDGNGKKGLVIKVDRLETWMYKVVPKGVLLVSAVWGMAYWFFTHVPVSK